jgi:outer membrane protein OmpA-like peptidoglycan-associated protein
LTNNKFWQHLPGIKSIGDRIQLQPTQLSTRIYFELGKTELTATSTGDKINQVQSFLTRYPNAYLKIIGHSDPSGSRDENQRLALERAKTVQDALLRSGIDRKRLEIVSSSTPPIDVDPLRSPALSRVVRFEPIYPPKN